tara:strand:+ start:49 stop:597 length:549 start_codon:yes stop_codon:yes gene_type:complete
MKYVFYLILIILITGCSSNKTVYWCGDHPCVNKKEKEAYFKKTMIVEVRKINNSDKIKKSEIEKITEQALIEEKKRVKKEKNLVKQAKLEEKRKIKEEKRLAKEKKKEEKRKIKEQKLAKKEKKIVKKKIMKKEKPDSKTKTSFSTKVAKIEIGSDDFKELKEKIINKNKFKTYPNINDIPN